MKIIHHIILWVVLLLFIAGAEASTPKERALERSGNNDLVDTLRDACWSTKNQVHCFGIGLSIAGAEAWFRSWRKHWYFGMIRPKDKSAYRWVQIYKTKRYSAQDWYFFYGDRGVLSPSRYCTSEHSSNSSVWCPNGRKNFNSTRHPYKKMFITWEKAIEHKQTEHESAPTPRCRYLGTIQTGRKLQIDVHSSTGFLKVLFEWVFGEDEKGLVFDCVQ